MMHATVEEHNSL